MTFVSVINNWFDVEWGGSIVLPDGWFGRPYDNQHTLTSCEESEGKMLLVLDDNLRLTFSGLANVEIKGRNLVLGPFDNLIFEAIPYGGGTPECKEYADGVVKIISAPG